MIVRGEKNRCEPKKTSRICESGQGIKKMILIGICDDEKMHRHTITQLCEQYFEEFYQEHRYIEFVSGEEVLAYQGDQIHLLFLDIEMGDASGLDVLDSLRESDKIWRIAFASSHGEQRLDTIDMKTLAFLDKPLSYEGVKKCLEIAIAENTRNISATFTLLDGKRDVKLSEIVYIRAEKHYVSVRAKQCDFMGYDSMRQAEEQLQGTTMIRIHKSYLVNMQYIKKLTAEEVLMSNGTRLPIGRKYKSVVKETFYQFVRSVTIGRNGAK